MPARRFSPPASWMRIGPLLLAFMAFAVVALQWTTDTVLTGNLLLEVPKVKQLDWLQSRWTYFYLHLFTFLPVFALSFDSRVHYYRKWKYLFPAILLVGILFIVWDVAFTARGVWGFNHDYLAGWFFWGLPVEEWLFFFTVPFACVFIYECLNYYVQKDLLRRIEPALTRGLIILCFGVGIWKFQHMYTATTFLLTGFFLLYHLLFEEGSYRSRFYLAYLVSWLPFLVVNGVLTGGYISEPVVIYNPEEYFGVRITSVPVDDSVYSFLLLFGTVTLFERFRAHREK